MGYGEPRPVVTFDLPLAVPVITAGLLDATIAALSWLLTPWLRRGATA